MFQVCCWFLQLVLFVLMVMSSPAQAEAKDKDATNHHLLTPEEFNSLCAFDVDTDTCFNRYVLKLVQKTEDKRAPMMMSPSMLNACPPGENSQACLDRYVKNIKLLKKSGVKRGAIQCAQPGLSRMSCFDKFISTAHLLRSRSSALCSPEEEKVSCFDRYINSMKLKPSYGKRGGKNCEAEDGSLECLDRYIKAIKAREMDYLNRQGVQCQPGEDDVGCFDKYVRHLQFKHSTDKRASVHCSPGEDNIACFDRHISHLKLIRRRESKQSRNFQCGLNEDDLSCFDRYITSVKLLPTMSKRSIDDSGCGPGDDSLECIDRYIEQIKLKGRSEKRFVDCQPGEDNLACFDRHVQTLKLRQTKRSLRPSSNACLFEDDSLACLDRYVRYLKLAERNSDKRASDCEFASDRYGCLDQYVRDLKLRGQKRAMMDPHCPPGADGLACFDSYVKNIKVRYLPMTKRFADCAPGEESVECFDRYINDLKLKHSPVIKRSPIFCAPGSNSWECFDQYVQDIKLKHRRDMMTPNRIPSPERRSSGLSSLRSGSWPLCPPTINRVQCFDRYLILMLKSLRTPVRAEEEEGDEPVGPETLMMTPEDAAAPEEGVTKRGGNYCPNQMDNLECFHTYLSHWVMKAGSPPKRTYRLPGKRSVDLDESKYRRSLPRLSHCSLNPSSKACLEELMMAFISVADIHSKMELDSAIQSLCEISEDAAQCEDQLERAAHKELQGEIPDADKPKDRDERSICPSGVDQVRCFESLLHAYMHKVVPKESTDFVGRRRALS